MKAGKNNFMKIKKKLSTSQEVKGHSICLFYNTINVYNPKLLKV